MKKSGVHREVRSPQSGRRALNDEYRNGGDIVEDREVVARDLVGDMMLARRQPSVLANALRAMGVTEGGDAAED
jgi:hypothetical protein